MKTLEEVIAFARSDAGRERFANRWSDPAYLRLREAIEHPLRGVPFVYMFMWDGDIVKVGKTNDFYTRRRAHMSNPLVRGVDLAYEGRWPSADLAGDEQNLLDLCVTAGGVRLKGREWFRVDPDALCDAIDTYIDRHPKT